MTQKKQKTVETYAVNGQKLQRKHTFVVEVTFERPLTRKQAKDQIDRVIERGVPLPGTTINRITVKDAARYVNGKLASLRFKLSRIRGAARATELCMLDLKDSIEKD